MKYASLCPCVRFASAVTRASDYLQTICAYDHRLFYVLDGSLRFHFSAEDVLLEKGDLLVFPPATPYRVFFPQKNAARYIILNFDVIFEEPAAAQAECAPVAQADFIPEQVISAHTVPPFDKSFHLKKAFFDKNQKSRNYFFKIILKTSSSSRTWSGPTFWPGNLTEVPQIFA